MSSTLTFRPSLISRIMSALLCGSALGLTGLALLGLTVAEGPGYVLLLATLILPILLTIAATLRMWTLLSRTLHVRDAAFDHHQLFKNHHVPWTSIRKLELHRRADGEVGILRIQWTGPAFYLDSTSVADWVDFVDAFMAHLPPSLNPVEVDAFEPLSP